MNAMFDSELLGDGSRRVEFFPVPLAVFKRDCLHLMAEIKQMVKKRCGIESTGKYDDCFALAIHIALLLPD